MEPAAEGQSRERARYRKVQGEHGEELHYQHADPNVTLGEGDLTLILKQYGELKLYSYRVHKGLLTEKMGYFRTWDGSEGDTRRYAHDSAFGFIKPAAVSAVLSYLYGHEPYSEIIAASKHFELRIAHCAIIYDAATRLEIPSLQHDAVRNAAAVFERAYTNSAKVLTGKGGMAAVCEAVEDAYLAFDQLPSRSVMRQVAATFCRKHMAEVPGNAKFGFLLKKYPQLAVDILVLPDE